MSIKQGSNYLAVSNVSVDGDTISANAYNSLQAIGTINKNSTAVDTVKYDWVGTTSEYIAQDIEHTHPEYTCYITDDDASELLNTAWASGLGMPNTLRYESLTVLATGSEYTAPANGWFFASGTCRSGASVGVVRLTNNTNPNMLVDSSSWCSGATGRTVSVFLPMRAGDTAEFIYGSYTNSDLKMIFVYAEGNGQ